MENRRATLKILLLRKILKFKSRVARKMAKMCHKIQTSDLQYENASWHHSAIAQDTIQALRWDLLPHPPYLPDLASSDYRLFRSMAYDLTGLHLTNFKEVQNWSNERFRSKDTSFYCCGIHILAESCQILKIYFY